MTSNNDFNSLLSQLQELEKSKNYLTIGNTLDRRFDSKMNDIIRKWISNDRLSNEENQFIDLYSNLQLYFVEYCFFDSQSTINNEDIIELFRTCLFRAKQIDDLKQAVIFIRDEQPSNDNINEDEMLIYLMRMLDARSLAYRLCFKELTLPPRNLNNELNLCLTHLHAKNYLYNMKSNNNTNKNMYISYRHQFFIGCCTFAVALFDENKHSLKNDDNKKYICLLAKYIRIVLNIKDFEQNKSFLYCLRGILALLTNCVPTENWMHIINRALANPNDDDAQQANPFNIDLFSLIIVRLLGSKTLRDKAIRSDSNDIISLVDVALIFLNKWYATSRDLDDDDDDGDDGNNNTSSLSDEPNQVLRLLRSSIVVDGKLTTLVDENLNTSRKTNRNKDRQLNTSQIIIPYIDAKYDRIRLMAMSILSTIMNYQDFKDLQEKKPNMAKDIVKLIFDFIDRAIAQGTLQYRGISFELLLRYLLRFLVQDFVKKQTIPYIPKIITYAEQRHLNALKILRKISSSPDMKQDLRNNSELKEFLTTKANALFASDPRMKNIIEQIRQNLAPEHQDEPSTPIDTTSRQAFISYCHRDKYQCDKFVQALREAKLFTNIWVDTSYMKDDMVDTITSAIRQSKVVFVLLSDEYCKSDFCRREWQFTITKKIKVYPVFVQEDFKREAFDWVVFNIGHNHFYKIYKNDELQRLIKNLHSDSDSDEHRKLPNKTVRLSISQTSVPETIETNSLNKNKNSKKKSIANWTSHDIQDWCRKNNLEKWCEPLAHYHGQALIELSRILENDTNLQHISNGHDITVMDVVLFKCELRKLLLQRKTRRKQPKKKNVIEHHSTNISTK
ncbi:unnamed protein product [Rotaria sordida]|uniref:TIR domain-containing protein n=1 Tax=Rotaria sordida TaxID=392033 RepID=A0A818UBI1_9BILA|nr:unnamed protein product [Rotaria sordida]